MPTILLHSVTIIGQPACLVAVRADEEWECPDHLAIYDLRREVDTPKDRRLHYRFEDDYKRPGPSIDIIAARHPGAFITHEYFDEFGDVGVRDFYGAGELASTERVDPRAFGWAEWKEDEPDPSAVDSEFGFADLVGAWRARQRYARAHPDLAKHHEARHFAFLRAFGVDLEREPKPAGPPPEWLASAMADTPWSPHREYAEDRWRETLIDLARSADQAAQRLSDPFADYLETPLPVAAAWTRYGTSIAAPIQEAQQALSRMIFQLFVAVHPDAAELRVSADDLRDAGFDPDLPAPDPDDYW